jgi:1-acyl-sn-glycerol-3-phosphate acyltransferase
VAAGADNVRRYRSRVRGSARFVAQDILLKSTVWSMCKVHVHGLERLDNVEPPFIVVGNHSSHLDAPLVFGGLPHRLSKHLATGAAADYFFDKKLKAATTSLFFNAYPVERKGLRTRQGLTGKLLDEGIPLLIFPEGTRSRTGAMGAFKPGVAALSISRDVPCLPVALVGAYAAWPYYRSIPPTGRPTVHVVFGHPLTALPGEIAHQFAERMRRSVAELYNTTAKAYGLPTLDDYERSVVLSRLKSGASADNAAGDLNSGGAALAGNLSSDDGQADGRGPAGKESAGGVPGSGQKPAGGPAAGALGSAASASGQETTPGDARLVVDGSGVALTGEAAAAAPPAGPSLPASEIFIADPAPAAAGFDKAGPAAAALTAADGSQAPPPGRGRRLAEGVRSWLWGRRPSR